MTVTDNSGGRTTTFADAPTTDSPMADPATGTPYKRWRMPVAVLEGVVTGDGRKIAPEALSWRELPQPLMANLETTAGHDGAQLVGRIDSATRVDASKMTDDRTGQAFGKGAFAIELAGVFTDDALATKVANLISGRFLRGVSVDLSDVDYEVEVLDPETGEPVGGGELDPIEALFFDGDMLETVTSGRIMGVTITPFPAFEGAYVELVDADGNVGPATQPGRPTKEQQKAGLITHSEFAARACVPCANGQPLTAGGGPQFPTANWFSDPKLTGPTPLTDEDSGRLYGHLALWGVCHTGFSGTCVMAPRSKTNYALFRTGAVKTAEGEIVATGPITIDTGHANIRDSQLAAMRHYDHTGTVVADVVIGEDEYGIWVAGALRPDATEAQVHRLRGSALSGDWRQWGGNLELIAALAVNTPGFPVTRQIVASGMPQVLIAAGASGALAHERSRMSELQQLLPYIPAARALQSERLARVRTKMRAARVEALRASMTAAGGPVGESDG